MTEVDDEDAPSQPTPWPFVIAFGLFVLLAFVAYRFLKEDPGRLVAPDQISVVDTDTVELRFDGPFRADFAEVTQVGFALGEDKIFVELVLDEYDCPDDATCDAPTDFVIVQAVLPEAIDGRKVEAGTGRGLLECATTEAASRDQVVCR